MNYANIDAYRVLLTWGVWQVKGWVSSLFILSLFVYFSYDAEMSTMGQVVLTIFPLVHSPPPLLCEHI